MILLSVKLYIGGWAHSTSADCAIFSYEFARSNFAAENPQRESQRDDRIWRVTTTDWLVTCDSDGHSWLEANNNADWALGLFSKHTLFELSHTEQIQ